jgi:hypothetical protein
MNQVAPEVIWKKEFVGYIKIFEGVRATEGARRDEVFPSEM